MNHNAGLKLISKQAFTTLMVLKDETNKTTLCAPIVPRALGPLNSIALGLEAYLNNADET